MDPTIPEIQPKKMSHKGSITGFVLAVLSLSLSVIAKLTIQAKYTPTGPTSGSVENEVGHAIATGTTTALGAIFGMAFIVGAVVLALISSVFIVIRLRKVKVGGLIFSLVAGALVVWSLTISFGALELIKA